MNATRYDLERFHNHMEYDNNTLIIAPRQSGKTFALVRKFLESRNAVLFTVNRPMKRHVEEMCYQLGAPDRRRDVHSLTYLNSDVVRRRRLDFIYIDEIDWHNGDLDGMFLSMSPTNARIVAVTTPSGHRPMTNYQRYFGNILNIDGRWHWKHFREPIAPDVFNQQEQELFRI